MTESRKKLAVVAIGGNSLIKDSKRPDVEFQWEAVRETSTHLAQMVEDGWQIVITHGNGPQVGFILRRSELAQPEVHPTPLDLIGADTQGSIGYMLQQTLENEFRRRGLEEKVVTLITQVLVDADDPAFAHPTKGIGGYLSEEEAAVFQAQGWTVVDDAGRGYRRMIASPVPQRIIEIDIIETLARQGFTLITVGGGGIPVLENTRGELRGTFAVIDKDRATALLAISLHANLFVISTAVEKVALNYRKPDEQWLDHLTAEEAQRYLDEGHFAAGSMKPKIEAVLKYLAQGGEKALVTNPENIARALAGETGTWILP